MMEAGRVDKLDQGARRVAVVDAGIQTSARIALADEA